MPRPDHAAPATLAIVPLTTEHLAEAHALSQSVGWPHRLEDWALSLSLSQGAAALDGGRLVGTALCTPFGPGATLNMISVAEPLQGQGLGRRLMDTIIAVAGARELRLVATEAGLPLYRKLGFGEAGRIVKHEGVARAAEPEAPVRFGPADPSALAAMDTDASGMERGALLSRIAADGETLTTEGGFALLRPFGKGHVLGPVVARAPAAARALMAAAAQRMAGRFLRIDLRAEHGLSDHALALGLAPAGACAAMVCDPRPRAPSAFQTFALVSQAMG